VNGDELDRTAGDTKVEADDRIDILAAVAGGWARFPRPTPLGRTRKSN